MEGGTCRVWSVGGREGWTARIREEREKEDAHGGSPRDVGWWPVCGAACAAGFPASCGCCIRGEAGVGIQGRCSPRAFQQLRVAVLSLYHHAVCTAATKSFLAGHVCCSAVPVLPGSRDPVPQVHSACARISSSSTAHCHVGMVALRKHSCLGRQRTDRPAWVLGVPRGSMQVGSMQHFLAC